MCGLFGWSGLKPGVFNKDKFNLLGIQNIERGKHSCGVTVDGEIYIGSGTTKVYTDFMLKNYDVLNPRRMPVVLGHTRHATIGLHTADNAHPFGFGVNSNDEDGLDFAFVGVHNGSLLNHKELAEKYKVDTEVRKKDKTFVRTKIDSEILLEILYKTKNFKVLSDYNGAAALKWCFTSDPDTVYYFHGMSCKQEGDVTKVEERPLFYWMESKNSLYTSSLEDSLYVIGGDDSSTGMFEHNTVYKVTNGDIENAVKYKVSRNNNWQKYGGSPRKKTTNTTSTPSSTNNNNTTFKQIQERSAQNSKVRQLNPTSNKVSVTDNIYEEVLPKNVNEYNAIPYFHKLRYWRNGHRIAGFWTFVDRYGFVPLGETFTEAKKSFKGLLGKVFINGEFKNADEVSDEDLQKGWIPFKENKETPTENYPISTFYDGIRVDSPLDLQGCINMAEVGRAFDVENLSLIAKHPIIDLVYANKDDDKQEIYLEGKLYTGRVTPLGSSRVYDIVKGNLVEIIELENESEADEELGDLMLHLSDIEKEENEKREAEEKEALVSIDFMDNFLKKVFEGPTEQLKAQKQQLKQYLPSEQARRAIAIIEHFAMSVHNLLEIEEIQ